MTHSAFFFIPAVKALSRIVSVAVIILANAPNSPFLIAVIAELRSEQAGNADPDRA